MAVLDPVPVTVPPASRRSLPTPEPAVVMVVQLPLKTTPMSPSSSTTGAPTVPVEKPCTSSAPSGSTNCTGATWLWMSLPVSKRQVSRLLKSVASQLMPTKSVTSPPLNRL